MSEPEEVPPKCPSPAPASPLVDAKKRVIDEDSNSCTSGSKNVSPKTKTNSLKPTSAAGAPLPLVSTPARDQSAIITKRMQNLQLQASPQPFIAGSPMRSFNTTPHKQCDLTPVMKNTATNGSAAVDLDLDLELDFDLDMLDSRGANEELNTTFSARPLHPGSMLPPLAKRGLFPAPKRSFEEDDKPGAIEIPTDARPPIRAPELAFLSPVEEPVPFPGKSQTFTSMKQYERRTQREADSVPDTAGLKPYQPSRQDPGLVDISQEALNSIFTTRRSNSQALSTPESTFTEEEDSNAMQGLFPAIPLEERQWSIPSIRLAHQVGGSVTSCTTYTDEDDESLLMYRDDASLSSYGSYSQLTGADEDRASNIQAIFMVGSDQQVAFDTSPAPRQLEDEEGMDTGDDSSLPSAPAEQNLSSRYHVLRRREKRKAKREHKALEWLRTVQAGQDEVAEAASSKFLTRRNDIINATPQGLYDKPQKRLSAAAVETPTFAFSAKDLEDDSCGGDDDGYIQPPALYEQMFASPSEVPAPIS